MRALRFLRRWLRPERLRPERQRPDLHVLVYTRRTCPLCDEALEMLRAFQARYGFDIRTSDVDESAELVKDYGNCVPVVMINGKVRFRGHVNAVLLKRILDAP
jgi:glutaredoxin